MSATATIPDVLDGAARWCIHHGDVLDALPTLPENSVDAVVCDAPYGLGDHIDAATLLRAWLDDIDVKTNARGFMGRMWDAVPGPRYWRECFRVLKPGGYLLTFAGTRTEDLMGLAIRLAGFERKDTICWLYSTGFPKSVNVERMIAMEQCTKPGRHYASTLPLGRKHRDGDHICPETPDSIRWKGQGSALAPSHEPIIVARKPLDGTYAGNTLRWGTALNIDATRIAHAGDADRDQHSAGVEAIKKRGGSMDESWKNSSDLSGANEVSPLGRWPKNTILEHSPACICHGTTSVPANPTWDTPNRNTEPSAFTGERVSKVRHGRDGEASAERRYGGEGSTSFAATPGPRRDAVEDVAQWECVTSGSALMPLFSLQRRVSDPTDVFGMLDLLRIALACIRGYNTHGTDHGQSACEASRIARNILEEEDPSDVACHALGLRELPGFRAYCPACHHSCNERVRRVAASYLKDAPSLADALELVIRLAESRQHIRAFLHSDQRSCDGSYAAHATSSMLENKTSVDSHPSSRPAAQPHNSYMLSEGPEKNGNRESTETSKRHDGAFDPTTQQNNVCTCDDTSLLVSLCLVLSSELIPQLECSKHSISWGPCPVKVLGGMATVGGSGTGKAKIAAGGSSGFFFSGINSGVRDFGDSGTAARFFTQLHTCEFDGPPFAYIAKPSRREKDAGLQHFRPRSAGEATEREEDTDGLNSPRVGNGRTGGARNVHPTSKSVKLGEWLCKLVARPGQLVLVPFAGGGSECIGALMAGCRVIGVELNDTDDEPFVSIAKARLEHFDGREYVPRESLQTTPEQKPRQGSLF